jgi:hypothetical protein
VAASLLYCPLGGPTGLAVPALSHPPAGKDIVRSFHSKNNSKQWADDSDEFFIEELLALKVPPKTKK